MSALSDSAIASTDNIPVAPENDYYTIRALPGKGYGCMALCQISRGTRILTDTPLLIVPMANYMKADIEAVFSSLTEERKNAYFTLHSGHGQLLSNWPSKIHFSVTGRERQRIEEQHAARTGSEATLISIFQTNCMEMGTGAAVFLHTSRFNHSCNPNACFSWNASIGKETIHTMRDIKAGEEITISYVDMEHDKRLRAWELKHYGFVCDCPACGDEGDETSIAYKSAENRLQIQELDRETRLLRGFRLTEGSKQPDFANKLLKTAVLLQKEGCWDARLAGVFLDIALVCEYNGDFGMGVVAGGKAVQIKKDCQGIDFPDFKKYAEAVERIKASRRREMGEANGWQA
ncbi:SET domain-containing protein [Didymella exigua CBS 183.55]|uniref:SET domain-containing protein n=1 Tax=Didymella exigua CBS 183.55 TaxID=1150837 RepID=A0A6A5RKS3_9PLEO|nr:SET domain-containing protein [Didymella exigua CBS 183.55]KAF1927708.1 SET domain-containing protein [Didymella exigua CBS 183.55]